MTLEDFFTLTEMKNGLATVARVEELISVMKQHDCVMSNVSDTTRQWSSVASILAATENEDCLSHFVKLNGLCYLNQWLVEAIKCSRDIPEIAIEELLSSLLGSLERLPVGQEESAASGILTTVEQLVGSKNLGIKEKATSLSERWKNAAENGAGSKDVNSDEKGEKDNLNPPNVVNKDNGTTHPDSDDSACREGPEEGSSRGETGCIPASQVESTDTVLNATTNQIMAATSLESAVADANVEGKDILPSAFAPDSCQETSGVDGSSPSPAVEMVSRITCCSNTQGDVADNKCDASEVKGDTVEDRKTDVDGVKDGRPDQAECSKVLSPPGLSASSHVHKPGRSVSCTFDAKELRHVSDSSESLQRSASIDCVAPGHPINRVVKPGVRDLMTNGSKLRIKTNLETSLDRKEEVGSGRKVKDLGRVSKLNISKLNNVMHDPSQAEKKSASKIDGRSELGLEYGEIDALEVARQVAIEVEREVVDYREPFCSSSPDGNSRGNSIEDRDLQFSDDQQDNSVNEDQNAEGSVPDEDLDDVSSPRDDTERVSETVGPSTCEQDVEMSEPPTHGSGDKPDQNRCVFDLNEDVCPEEPECSINLTPNTLVNVSTPIAVSASKGAPCLPVPIRFEGELGWKGSAATSAFRPASPRRTPDVEKTSSGQKRKANLIEFDLNVAESGDEAVDPSSVKPVPYYAGIPSREDSVEVSSKRADRLKLDLNRVGDEDVSPFPSSYWGLPHQNGNRTMSPASSSSSRQPTTRDFDLNDNPGFFDVMGSHNLSRFSSKSPGMYAGSKPDSTVISIMGSKIAERRDYLEEPPLALMGNGPSLDAAVVAPRPLMPYSHIPLPAYGYNGPVMGPPMPFPPPFYGHGSTPYMVDSRGATIMPQFLSSPGLNTVPSSMPPFLMSMSTTPPGLNGPGTSQSGLDLNSGFTPLDAASRESGNFRHFLTPGHNGLMEDGARAAPQPPTAGLSLNRKEADSGWEPYSFGYKQVTSWQ